MGWFAIFQAIAQGLTNAFSTGSYINENKKQAEEIARQAQEQADERAKKAKAVMQQQKSSFLKGGVYFDSGSPVSVIDETYDTAMQDIAAIEKDSLTQQGKLIRAGKTAFYSFLIDPLGNNGSQIASNIFEGFNTGKKSSATNINGTKMSGGEINTKDIA